MNQNTYSTRISFKLPDYFGDKQFALTLRPLTVKERNKANEQPLANNGDDWDYAVAQMSVALEKVEGFDEWLPASILGQEKNAETSEAMLRALPAVFQDAIIAVYARWRGSLQPSFFTPPSESSAGKPSITNAA